MVFIRVLIGSGSRGFSYVNALFCDALVAYRKARMRLAACWHWDLDSTVTNKSWESNVKLSHRLTKVVLTIKSELLFLVQLNFW